MKTVAMVLLVIAGILAGRPAHAEDAVDLALVLVVDVSRSVDDDEFQLQRQGYAAAFTDPRVLQAIRGGPIGRIAVSFVEFAASSQIKTVIDWTVLRDGETAGGFADQLQKLPRSFAGFTSISGGIDAAVKLLKTVPVQADRLAMDVSGDGTNNSGRDVTAARDDAIAAGIVINGLAIVNEHPSNYTFAHVQPPEGLQEYYRRNVIGGPGSFVLVVHDFRTFAEAMTKKLVSEIAAGPAEPGRPPM